MRVYLRAKFQVFSVILPSFRRGGGGGGVILHPPATSKRTPKKTTRISLKHQNIYVKFFAKLILKNDLVRK